ncbi:hypothetical protein DL767_004977 [Monosporascus sp. MG133]|nr:hypothetical protein DL767_004977 [Monosporascus sp. MG133]
MIDTSLFRVFAVATMAVLPSALAAPPLRNVMYYDDGHTTLPEDTTILQNITHVIMSFVDPSDLYNGTSNAYTPFIKTATEVRSRFPSETKFGFAIGGWELTPNFNLTVDPVWRQPFVKNAVKLLDELDFDFIDIDWEYPGGDGIDYKNKAAESKKAEVENFPLLMEELRNELNSTGKGLSIAVPGKPEDIAVYKQYSTRIWKTVDFVNVMAYDLMNRRNNGTGHHASLAGANDSITDYVGKLGLDPRKINLGFPFYAKFFELEKEDCSGPLGCKLVAAENANGSDAFTSDTVTFEAHNYLREPAKIVAFDGLCGPSNGLHCAVGHCCSRWGYCGDTDEFCGRMCLSNFGDCHGNGIYLDMVKSFQAAVDHGKFDEVERAWWYIDTQYYPRNFFWTWDTPDTIEEKITEIVKKRGLGGVMAWSLGEDSYDWARLKAMNAVNTQ